MWWNYRFHKLIAVLLIIGMSLNGAMLFGDSYLLASELSQSDTESILPNGVFSDNWEDYKGDLETFVYGAIEDLLAFRYDVFPGDVELEDGTVISGICYTDYSECYTDEDETETYIMAGMIPYYGEEEIPEEEFEKGLILRNVDYEDDNTKFVLSMQSAPFKEHCVIYGKYLTYGVGENGQIEYDAEEYVQGRYDKSLGSLYSYDDKRFIFDNDVGNYVDVSVNADSLYAGIDFDALDEEIERILETQDKNFASMDIASYVQISKEAVTSYLLSLQQETFFGYDVQELIEASKNIDANECIQITESGLNYIDYTRTAGKSASTLTKWLVGTGCAVAAAVGVVGAVVFIECPPLSAISGSIAGVAIETFMQVVISSRALEDINWDRVAIAAVTGAVAGFIGPYVSATLNGPAYFLTDSCIDGLLGGLEYSVSSWLAGDEGTRIVEQAGFGFALGFALSAGFKVAAKGAEKVIKAAEPKIKLASERVFPNLTKKVSNLTGAVGDRLTKMKLAAEDSVFHSEYIKAKVPAMGAKMLDDKDEIKKISFDALTKEDIYDEEGMLINKTDLEVLFDSNTKNNTVLGYVGKDKSIQLRKQNGVVGIVFDDQYQTVTIPGYLKDNRDANFEEAANVLLDNWRKNNELVPNSISAAISMKGEGINSIDAEALVGIGPMSRFSAK